MRSALVDANGFGASPSRAAFKSGSRRCCLGQLNPQSLTLLQGAAKAGMVTDPLRTGLSGSWPSPIG
jgi:hypothetical protein